MEGGIGTSSRVLPASLGGWTVGVLVQTNFGGILQVLGAPVGKELGQYAFKRDAQSPGERGDGSCVMVVATDAPLSDRNLETGRIATIAIAVIHLGLLVAHLVARLRRAPGEPGVAVDSSPV